MDDKTSEDHVLEGRTWWTRDRTQWWDGSKWRSARETPPNPPARAAGEITPPPPPPVGRPGPPSPAPLYSEPPRPIVETTVSAGTAFKIGFFGGIGFVISTALLWLFLFVTFNSLLSVGRQ